MFSVKFIYVVPFYKWVLHKAYSESAKTVFSILTEKVKRKNVPSSLDEGQPSSETVTEQEKTFLVYSRTQHTKQILHTTLTIGKFAPKDQRIMHCFNIELKFLNISARFLNGSRFIQTVVGGWRVEGCDRRNSTVATCMLSTPSTFEFILWFNPLFLVGISTNNLDSHEILQVKAIPVNGTRLAFSFRSWWNRGFCYLIKLVPHPSRQLYVHNLLWRSCWEIFLPGGQL